MARKVPLMTTDEEANVFPELDLSDPDIAQLAKTKFEFETKDARVNMRLPQSLLDAIKTAAAARGLPYQRYVRQVLESAVREAKRTPS